MFSSLYWFHQTPNAQTYFLFRLPSNEDAYCFSDIPLEYPLADEALCESIYAKACNSYVRFVYSHRDADGNFDVQAVNRDAACCDRVATEIYLWMLNACKSLGVDWTAYYNQTLRRIAAKRDRRQWNCFCNLFAPDMNRAVKLFRDKRHYFYK